MYGNIFILSIKSFYICLTFVWYKLVVQFKLIPYQTADDSGPDPHQSCWLQYGFTADPAQSPLLSELQWKTNGGVMFAPYNFRSFIFQINSKQEFHSFYTSINNITHGQSSWCIKPHIYTDDQPHGKFALISITTSFPLWLLQISTHLAWCLLICHKKYIAKPHTSYYCTENVVFKVY